MTADQVEQLALEAGFNDHQLFADARYDRFAELIERAAMEKAAKIAEAYRWCDDDEREDSVGRLAPEDSNLGCAAAIRAAAQKQV